MYIFVTLFSLGFRGNVLSFICISLCSLFLCWLSVSRDVGLFFLSEREGVKLAYICFWFVSIVKFLAEKISFFIVSPIIIIG